MVEGHILCLQDCQHDLQPFVNTANVLEFHICHVIHLAGIEFSAQYTTAGDIDFMLVPPASLGRLPCGPLLQKLLTRLLEVNLLVDELEPTRPRVPEGHEGSASWMGIARPPGSPHFRRIDVKVYPSRCVAAFHEGPACWMHDMQAIPGKKLRDGPLAR